jgi:starvation-inducible DNA-binding protein
MAPKNRNPLSTETKKKVGAILLPLVYDSIELKNQVKLAHWNLHDRDFISVHRLLDEVAATVDKGTDEMAERARQLGIVTDASTKAVAKNTTLSPFPEGIINGATACEAVLDGLVKAVDALHKSIDACDEAGDAVSADLLTKISGELEIHLWFFESRLG